MTENSLRLHCATLNVVDNDLSFIGNAESSITSEEKSTCPGESVKWVKCDLGPFPSSLSCSRKRETHVPLMVTPRTCTSVLVSVRRASPAWILVEKGGTYAHGSNLMSCSGPNNAENMTGLKAMRPDTRKNPMGQPSRHHLEEIQSDTRTHSHVRDCHVIPH